MKEKVFILMNKGFFFFKLIWGRDGGEDGVYNTVDCNQQSSNRGDSDTEG